MNDLAGQLLELLRGLDPNRKTALDRVLATKLKSVFKPNPGPQTDAYVSEADIVLFGGSAGGGKTALESGVAAEHRRAIIFRRESAQLDGLIDIGKTLYGDRARFNANDSEFIFTDRDCRIKLGGMQQADDWRKYAGIERDYIAFDEAAEFLEVQVASIIAWNRSSVPGQRCRVILGSNPPRGSDGLWMLSWFAPWLDPLFANPAAPGELRWAIMVDGRTRWVDGPEPVVIDGETYEPLSRTFIPSRLDDNPYLRDTNYRSRLMSLPEPLRSQLLHGDFEIGKTDAERQVIPSAWVEAAQARWTKDGGRLKMLSLGVDVAQGGADQTVLAALHGTWFAELVVRPGVETPDGPSIAALVVQTMRNGCSVNIDCSGGWGGSARDHLIGMGMRPEAVVFGSGSSEHSKDGTFAFYNLRAQMLWRLREALEPVHGDDIALPPDRRLAAELTAATWSLRGDKILVESKDDIRKRLGVSPDRADAVMLAWHKRDQALFMQKHGKKLDREWRYTDDSDWDPYDGPKPSRGESYTADNYNPWSD